jgi:hypothetical protein
MAVCGAGQQAIRTPRLACCSHLDKISRARSGRDAEQFDGSLDQCRVVVCAREVFARPPGLPRDAHCPGAAVGGRAARELAVELARERDAVDEAKLGAGGGERGVLRRSSAGSDAPQFARPPRRSDRTVKPEPRRLRSALNQSRRRRGTPQKRPKITFRAGLAFGTSALTGPRSPPARCGRPRGHLECGNGRAG